jgi:hypothetical protein
MSPTYKVGDEVEVLESGSTFTVAAIDGDTAMRGEDGAWFHFDDLCSVEDSILADLFLGELEI